jgi:pimeloyl-ACP methyl ester carboxylesterase
LGRLIPGARRHELKGAGLSFSAYEMGEGPLVLCVHGFPDTPATWRFLLPDLAAAGFRAVAVTLRGYEASSQPADGDFALASLVDDVLGWVAALGARKAHLIGHDWGSTLVQLAAARGPDVAASVTALAVAHPAAFAARMAGDFAQLERSWYVFMFQAPGLADALLQGGDFLEFLWRRWSPGWTPTPTVLAAARAAFREPGVAAGALAFYRRAFDPDGPGAAASQALLSAPIRAPVLGLAGERDGCVGVGLFQDSFPTPPFMREPKIEQVAGAGHFLHLERPEQANPQIVHWLKSHPAPDG